jgi:hypothetical protein
MPWGYVKMPVMLWRLKLAMLPLLFLMAVLSCDDDTDALQEAPKELNGTWQIVSVFRNEVDITESIDLSKFRLTFKGDGSYTIDNYLPFIVRGNGKFSLDDPQYPFRITFHDDATQETVNTDLTYPVVLGKRQIRLSFSPGCVKNTYQYILEEAQ